MNLLTFKQKAHTPLSCVNIFQEMILHNHVSSIATTANLLMMHNSQIRLNIEYLTHIWGATATTLSMLVREEGLNYYD